MMKTALVLWVILAVLCLGQGHHEGHHDDHHGKDHTHGDGHEHEHHHQDDNSSLPLVKKGNAEFAFRLYKQLTTSSAQGKNVFFSPMSVTLALAAVSVGARGQTHQELFSGLGFNDTLLTQQVVDKAFQTLLTAPRDKSAVDMAAGGALYLHNTFKVNPAFLGTLKQFYLSDSFTVDFTKTAEATDTINKYVGEKTGGKINKLVSDLDSATVMYLVSYMYYKGKWEIPFDPEDTRQGTFHVDDQTDVQVQMMHVEDEFSTYYDQEISTTILHLNYNDSNSMILALPEKGLAPLEKVICKDHITKWRKWKKTGEYKLFVPKFSIKTSSSLNDVLKAMGMTDMFTDAADFSGISEGLKVKVSEVVHQATLDVDEFGATAAAATGVGFIPLSFRHVPELRFDHPFMVLIVDSVTDSILFMGKIVNPKE